MSRYFSPKTQKSSDIDEVKWINPFKCHKIIPKDKDINEDLNETHNSSNFIEENNLQCQDANIDTNSMYEKTPDAPKKAFNWISYVNDLSMKIPDFHDEKASIRKIISQNYKNNRVSIKNDNKKVKILLIHIIMSQKYLV